MRTDGHTDLHQKLRLVQRGLVRSEEELPDADGAPASGALGDEGRPQCREGRGQVLRRIGLAQRTAHGAAVAYERIGDDPLRVPQDGEVFADDRRGEQFRVADHRSDGQVVPVHPDQRQLAEAVDVDEGFGLGQPQFHHRQQAVSARHHPCLGAVPCEQLDRLLEAGGPLVLECSRNLHRALLDRSCPLLQRCCALPTGRAMDI